MTALRARWLLVAILIAVVAAGCGDDDASDGGLTASDAWARATAPDAATAAFYVEIDNDTDASDTLTGAATDVCGMVEIHTMVMEDDVMSMMPAEQGDRTVGAGESLVLEPGGLHVMCMGLQSPLEVDDAVDLELTFESGTTIDISAEIRSP